MLKRSLSALAIAGALLTPDLGGPGRGKCDLL